MLDGVKFRLYSVCYHKCNMTLVSLHCNTFGDLGNWETMRPSPFTLTHCSRLERVGLLWKGICSYVNRWSSIWLNLRCRFFPYSQFRANLVVKLRHMLFQINNEVGLLREPCTCSNRHEDVKAVSTTRICLWGWLHGDNTLRHGCIVGCVRTSSVRPSL